MNKLTDYIKQIYQKTTITNKMKTVIVKKSKALEKQKDVEDIVTTIMPEVAGHGQNDEYNVRI